MSITRALRSELVNTAAVTNLVSTRVYRNMADPDATLPYVVFSKASDVHEYYMGGSAALLHPRFIVTSWDDDALGADALAAVVKTALTPFARGTMGVGANTATVHAVFLETELDDYEPPAAGKRVGTYGVRQDFIVWHKE